MVPESPTVLIASVSAYERQRIARLLGGIGARCPRLAVEDAAMADRLQAARGPGCVLVIDSGLLHAPRDPQWRALRLREPWLGAAVRCLVPGVRRVDARTFHVPPDDAPGILGAVGTLFAERLWAEPACRRAV